MTSDSSDELDFDYAAFIGERAVFPLILAKDSANFGQFSLGSALRMV
jgi:hypothetical protein